MFIHRVHIQIGSYTFNRANSVEIVKSTELLTDTATIKLPLSAVLVDNDKRSQVEIAKLIKVGDKVEVKAWYDGYEVHTTQFSGYVKRLNYQMPVEIECEDATYLLRRKNINKSWKETTLKEVLNEILSGTGLTLKGDVPSIELEPFYIKNATAAFTLQKLKDEFGLTIYLDGDKLYCGLAYTEDKGSVIYNLTGENTNVIKSGDLKYRAKEDIRMKVKAIAVQGDNSRLEVELGDEDGALRTLHFYNIKSLDVLKKLAKQEIEKYKFDGYEGSLLTFLIPAPVPGMTAVLNDPKFDRSGSYYIKGVKTTMTTSGARHSVEIGVKL
jgi:hypothetical protein